MPDLKKFNFVIDELNEEAALSVGDQTYRILYDFQAIYLFYRTFGINPVFEAVGQDPVRLAALLWVGLLCYQPDVDAELVKSWFTSTSSMELYEGTARAFRMTMPQPESGGTPPDPPSA